MKNSFFAAVCLITLLAASTPTFAQSSSDPSSPSREELESVIGGMGLSMGEKLSLRNILQAMQEQGAKVRENGSLSDEQKTTQIVQIRQNALNQTQTILTAPQQQKLTALLLPKQ